MNGIELAEHIGVTYRQVDYWTRRGFVRPYVLEPGIGHQRDYSWSEVRVARRMAALVAAGLTVQAAHSVARGDKETIDKLMAALLPADVLWDLMEAA